ncbi:CCA tRNA nucleotidyltransferase [Sphingomonas canadensis]|uniref:CCA tRNA nucleotidyltransferase n=1 Tax=Sphingomonas canadensis TaxID=1219257 RepID=A0ABW3HDC6_9SPHN|nr:CCA tRNA nucleotidyltransferase [Sphingomonas canadensis]MCW3838026.1 CCA tRNA nucleotidyltransferase [Sphingomonas canadensis]
MAGLTTLPPADWRERPGLDGLAQTLGAAAGEARFVGGAVRDTLLGAPVADIDIATVHPPEEVMRRLKAAGIRAVPTGLAHGTVTAVLDSGPVEVTTLRRDINTDGRHATVAFTADWRADAARRDFTFNALYADPISGQLYDYFDGLADLERRHVRFIGDPLERIAEDHLRILRFFRFLARFGDMPDPAALAACTARANDLMALSRERIADELLKLLVARNAVTVIELMVSHGILLPVLPEIDLDGAGLLRHVALLEEQAGLTPDPVRRLAALLPRDARVAEAVGARLKLSNVQRKRLVSATADAAGAPEELAYRIGAVEAIDRILLSRGWAAADPVHAARHLSHWQVPRLPLSGGAIVARGVSAGPQVARLLRQVEERWIAEGFPDSARTEAIADAVVAAASAA